MERLAVYFAPGSCARVSLIALEEAGHPFEARLVRFMKGEHRSAEYLRLNPAGKVPLLLVDGAPLAENVAILHFLARCFPEARLLPLTGEPLSDARVLAELAWCASGLHPLVTRLRMPQLVCDLPEGCDRVWELAIQAMTANFRIIERRLDAQPWMLGEWSVLDAYVYWVWFRATGAGLDGSAWPRYAAHAQRMEQRPSVQRVLAREREAEAQLEKEGLTVRFAPSPGARA